MKPKVTVWIQIHDSDIGYPTDDHEFGFVHQVTGSQALHDDVPELVAAFLRNLHLAIGHYESAIDAYAGDVLDDGAEDYEDLPPLWDDEDWYGALSDIHIHDEGNCCECNSPYHCCCECPVFRNGDITGLTEVDIAWLKENEVV